MLINAIGLFVVVVEELVCPVALLLESEPLDGECADLEGTQGDVFCKLFVENLIFLSEVDIGVPVPLALKELLVLHIATQRHLFDRIKLHHIPKEGC